MHTFPPRHYQTIPNKPEEVMQYRSHNLLLYFYSRGICCSDPLVLQFMLGIVLGVKLGGSMGVWGGLYQSAGHLCSCECDVYFRPPPLSSPLSLPPSSL